MAILVISLILLGVVCATLGFVSHKRGEDGSVVTGKGDCASCTGDNAACEQVCAMRAATRPIEYFDDEELDAYKGRPSDSYDDDETARFAYVLETLRPGEIKAWNRSLILRGINMPDGIKDEYIALASAT